ncbi:MAG: TolC family protein [Myxococcales bacterium]|nr:TolC family protein [Myxococcales bacterium]MBL0193175.1 TolC family protein [Myxococcales bacterium]HQY61009.1 TolC family protein [Polyangiaceae bacterium]
MRTLMLSDHSLIIRGLWGLALALGVAAPSSAHALEPLDGFVASARRQGFDARESRATLAQREGEVSAANLRLLPVLGAQGTLTRNQYEAKVGDKTIVPLNQADLFLTASWTVVDVGQWERIGAAKRTLEAAESRAKVVELDVERAVSRDYYQVVAAEAVREAAGRTLAAAEKNASFVEARRAAGLAQELDGRRAQVEVARGQQIVADATYQVAVARRALETDSGQRPSTGAPALTADLQPEAPLSEWEGRNLDGHPAVKAAAADARALERSATATRASLLPTLSVAAQERLTNATGFQDRASIYALSATAAIRFDVGQLSAANAQERSAEAAKVREERARAAARDRVFGAWHLVRAQIDKARAARAGLVASRLAAETAKQRYEAGTATFLDVVVAERDAFQAEVTRIQADGDLLFSRADLRLAAGGHATDAGRSP